METLRQRKIHRLPEVDRILESYIQRTEIVPKDAIRIRIAASVKLELRGLVMQAVKTGKTWMCWADSRQFWLFTAKISPDVVSPEHGAPVIIVNLYGADGSLREGAALVIGPGGQWQRSADNVSN